MSVRTGLCKFLRHGNNQGQPDTRCQKDNRIAVRIVEEEIVCMVGNLKDIAFLYSVMQADEGNAAILTADTDTAVVSFRCGG